MSQSVEPQSVSRRTVLAVGAGAAVVPALAGCADPSEDPTLRQPDRAEAGTFLVNASDVPVDGCFVVARASTVVTQPVEGEFKAFSGVCTHKHCFLASSQQGFIPCRCHGSQFSLTDGSVLAGPAEKSLEEYEITVEGGRITLA